MKTLVLAAIAATTLGAAAYAQDAASFGPLPATYPVCAKPGQDRCRVVVHHAARVAHKAAAEQQK